MTNHTIFNIVSVISLIVIVLVVGTYDYGLITEPTNTTLRYVLKPIPLFVMVILPIFYFILYRLHIYALLIEMVLLFCLIGDVSLMFHNSPGDHVLLIIGGASFFIGRIIMSLAFIIYPFKSSQDVYINITKFKLILAILVGLGYTIAMAIYFVIYMNTTVLLKILLPIYLLSMGSNLTTSILRLGGFSQETLRSQIFGMVGTLLFIISDTLLFWDLFINYVKYLEIVSITIYWAAMYLITISIIRTNSYESEKFQYYIL